MCPDLEPEIRPGSRAGELLVFDHGFVRLDEAMADDLSVVNGARVSFAAHREEMSERDAGLIKFLMRSQHGSPFEHNSFRFHIRCPIFVAREWFRHRVGCLTGDTRVSFVDSTGAAAGSKRMDELWRIWSQHQTIDEARSGLQSMCLRVLNEDTNEFQVGHVREVMYSGLQPVYEVTLDDGKRMTATENHRLLTSSGWRSLRKAIGLSGTPSNVQMTRPCSLLTNGLLISSRRGCRMTGRPVSVVAVEYIGVRPTYDLRVDGPWHNFVANGIVVHNSFNEESARYHKLQGDFYVPSERAVRGQVGKPGAYSFEPAEHELAIDTIATFERVYKQLYDEYETLVEKGVAKELARALLPFGIYTQFFWTLNARSLMNFLALRNAPSAQYEIRVYAQAVERHFAEKMPVTHACFEEFGRTVP